MPNFSDRWKLTILDTSDSTNTYLDQLSRIEKLASRYMVRSVAQLQGRGQRGNTWESDTAKNLTCSFYYRPANLLIYQQFLFSQCVALAVSETVDAQGLTSSVKWPNDIYVNDGKVAGILIENSIAGEAVLSVIAGIGLNINQTVFVSDAPNPVSLAQLTGHFFDIDTIWTLLMKRLDFWLRLLDEGLYAHIEAHYMKKLYRFGEYALFQNKENTFYGRITGVQPSGALEITDELNVLHTYYFKEVRFVD